MKLAIGIDVHKELCTAHATYGGATVAKPKQQYFIDRFNGISGDSRRTSEG